MAEKRRWSERVAELIRRVDLSVLLAFGLSVAFFAWVITDYLGAGRPTMSETVRWAAASVLLFVVLFGILRVLVGDIRREVVLERKTMAEGCGTEGTLLFFVVFKALIRCIVGVNLVLLWMAGLFAVLEQFSGEGMVVGVLLALILSAAVLFTALGLVNFLDRIRYPCD